HILNTAAGKEVQTLRQPEGNALMFSPDGSRIATGGEDGIARVFEVASGKELDHRILRGPISGLALSSDGSRVVAAAKDELYVWAPDVEAAVLRFAAGQKSVFSLSITASGKHIHTGGTDGTVKVWELQTGKEVMKIAAPDWQRDVRVVPELPYFLSGRLSQPGDTLRLWEIIGVQ